MLAAFIDSSTLVEFCERALKAQRVIPIPLRHANGCSPAYRLSARASWRPRYPLLSRMHLPIPTKYKNYDRQNWEAIFIQVNEKKMSRKEAAEQVDMNLKTTGTTTST